jgi:nitrogen-specific signal transduction histidine kinase
VSAGSRSLLTYLDAPIVVGDPDGRVAYINPAFQSSFSVSREAAAGQSLAQLFDGGARESLLRSVAEVCERGRTVRFRLRQGDQGFSAIASPIVAEDQRVGVVILLMEAAASEEHLLALHREIREPLDDLARLLDEMLEQTGGRRSERHRDMVESGMRAVARIRKWSDELHGLLSGETVAEERAETAFDPVRVVRDVAARVSDEISERGVDFEVLVPAQLPMARGDAKRLEMVLTHLLRARLGSTSADSSVILAARTVGAGEAKSVLISIVDSPGDGSSMQDPTEPEPQIVLDLVRDLDGDVRTTADPLAGRTTAIRLNVA